ncbi:integrase core domain protein [Aphelenchoides avenae]|nr:integrase core domain protein [Aphelenchus avenae]
MFDNQGSQQDRGRQTAYEDRSHEIQRHIWRLQDEHDRLSAASQRLHASDEHSQEDLNRLIVNLRSTTIQIRHCIAEYCRAVEDWNVVIDQYRLREDNSSWAQVQRNDHAAFFTDPSLAPSLEDKFRDLLRVYHDIQDEAEVLLIQRTTRDLDDVHLQASPSGSPAPSHNDGNGRLFGRASSSSRRPEPSYHDGKGHVASDATLPSPSAAYVPKPPPRDSTTTDFYSPAPQSTPVQSRRAVSTASRTTMSRRAADTPQATAQSPLHTSFRGGRTFVNSTYHRSSRSRPAGIMHSVDGDIARPIPMAWHPSPRAETTAFAAAATRPAEEPRARGDSLHAAPTAPATNPTADHHRSRLHNTFHSATHSTAAGGKGSETSSSGPLRIGADGRPLTASTTFGTLGSAATPVDFGEDFGSENSSAFCRNATYNRATTTNPSQPSLVLKELPLDPFEGDFRQYPRFRNRFLEIVEAQVKLEPRHKLQYLLQYLRGEPHRLANGFQLTDSNYFTVINLLEERYGNADLIRNLLMQDLIAIRPPSSGAADLRRFHDEAFRVTTELKQLGDNVDATRLYEQSLMAKLTPALKTELIRNSDYAVKKSVSSILEGLRKYTQVLELTNNSGILWQPATGQSSQHSSSGAGRPRSPYRQDRPPSNSHRSPIRNQSNQRTTHGHYAADAETIYVADVQEAAEVCPLCSQDHQAVNCTKYLTIYMRIWRAMKLGLCSLCLQESHRSESCPSSATYSCPACQQGHHEALCPTKEVDSPPGADRRRTNSTTRVGGQVSDTRHPLRVNPVRRGDSLAVRESTVSESVPPSAQLSSTSNLNENPREAWKEEERTTPKGRLGTIRPTTTTTHESVSQQDAIVSADGLLLNGRPLLPECRSPRIENVQFPEVLGTLECRGNRSPDRVPREGRLHEEEVSTPPVSRRRHHDTVVSLVTPDIDRDVTQFATQPAVHRSTHSSGDVASTESASTTITEDPPASSPPPSREQAVILEGIKTAAWNPSGGYFREVTLVFDSASTLTCISPQLAEDMKLERRNTRPFKANTFGSSMPTAFEASTVTIALATDEREPLHLHATTAPNDFPPFRIAPIDEEDLAALRTDSLAVPITQEKPDILIGQDNAHLFERTTLPRLPHGFAVIGTIMGPVLSGLGRVAAANPPKAVPSFSEPKVPERPNDVTLRLTAPEDVLARSNDVTLHPTTTPVPLLQVSTPSQEPSAPPSLHPDGTDATTVSEPEPSHNDGKGREPSPTKAPAPLTSGDENADLGPKPEPSHTDGKGLDLTRNTIDTRYVLNGQLNRSGGLNEIRWYDHRPPTDRHQWTQNWAQTHLPNLNPLDTEWCADNASCLAAYNAASLELLLAGVPYPPSPPAVNVQLSKQNDLLDLSPPPQLQVLPKSHFDHLRKTQLKLLVVAFGAQMADFDLEKMGFKPEELDSLLQEILQDEPDHPPTQPSLLRNSCACVSTSVLCTSECSSSTSTKLATVQCCELSAKTPASGLRDAFEPPGSRRESFSGIRSRQMDAATKPAAVKRVINRKPSGELPPLMATNFINHFCPPPSSSDANFSASYAVSEAPPPSEISPEISESDASTASTSPACSAVIFLGLLSPEKISAPSTMSHASDDEFLEDNRAVYQNLDDSDVDSERDMVVSTPRAEAHRNRRSATPEPSHTGGDGRGAAEDEERAQNSSSRTSEPSHTDGNEGEADEAEHQQRSSSAKPQEPSHNDGEGGSAESMDTSAQGTATSDWSAHTPATSSSQSAEASSAEPRPALFSNVTIRTRTHTAPPKKNAPKKLALKKKAPSTVPKQNPQTEPNVPSLRKGWITVNVPPFEPKLPKRRPPAQPIVELANGQSLRSVQKLVKFTQRIWRKYLNQPAVREQYAKKGPPIIWNDSWKRHPYGHKLWIEYQLLHPDVKDREAQDRVDEMARNATSGAPREQSTSADAPPSTSADAAPSTSTSTVDNILLEWEKQFPSKAMAPEEESAAHALVFGNPDQQSPLDYDETTPSANMQAKTPAHSSTSAAAEATTSQQPSSTYVPQDESSNDPIIVGMSQILQTPQSNKKPTSSGPYRNPSPPKPLRSTPVPPLDPPPIRQQAEAVLALADTMMRKAAEFSSTAKSSQIPMATRTVSRPPIEAPVQASSGSRQSRTDSGKRSHATSGRSHQPPAHRRRRASCSRTPPSALSRSLSPGLDRKNKLRRQATRPPIPLIDGFVCKDLVVYLQRNGQVLPERDWPQRCDQPNDDYQLLGVINTIGIPRCYMPPDTFADVQATEELPLANLTLLELHNEDTVIPWRFILCHTFGCYPAYADMVTSETRETLGTLLKDQKYHQGLRSGGVGPTGYNVCDVPDERFFDTLDSQRVAFIRLARAAKKSGKCLMISIESDNRPPQDYDLHGDAIRTLQQQVHLPSDHPIHLIMYNANGLQMAEWLEAFPNALIGIHPGQLAEYDKILTEGEGHLQYPATVTMATMLRRVPLRNLAVQSACPFKAGGQDYLTPDDLIRIGAEFQQLTGTSGDVLQVCSAHNLTHAYKLNSDLLRHMANANDRDGPPRCASTKQLVTELRATFAAVARADSANQEAAAAGRRSSLAEASPMQVDRAADEPSGQPKRRSKSAATSSRSPLKHRGDHERGRRSSKDRHRVPKPSHNDGEGHVKHRDHTERKRPEPSHTDGNGSAAQNKESKGPEPSHTDGKGAATQKQPSRRARSPRSQPPPKVQSQIVVPPSSLVISLKDGQRSISDKQKPKASDKDQAAQSQTKFVVSLKGAPPTDRSKDRSSVKERIGLADAPSGAYDPAEGLRLLKEAQSRPKAPAEKARSPSRHSAADSSTRATPTDKTEKSRSSSRHSVADSSARTSPTPISKAPTAAKTRSRRVHDPMLKDAPIRQERVPPPTLEEIKSYVRHFFRSQQVPGEDRLVTRVDSRKLGTQKMVKAQPSTIQVTHGCDLPWDPARVCRGDNEDRRRFHLTLNHAKIVGPRKRWADCQQIKDSDEYQEILNEVMESNVTTFGQTILLKYATRLRCDNQRVANVLKFVRAVVMTEDHEEEIPRLLAKYQPLMTEKTKRAWPDEQDWERAAWHWVCYCPDAYKYLYDRLSGPATWNTGWLQNESTPQGCRDSIKRNMIDRAPQLFDDLRHRLYKQYGLPDIKAAINNQQILWERFDTDPEKRVDIDKAFELKHSTVCFVDQTTYDAFHEKLASSARMIVLPAGDADVVYYFVSDYYPANVVRQVFFWFGRDYIRAKQNDYRDLAAELCHLYTAHFGNVEQFVVLPPYMRDFRRAWTAGPLAFFAQREKLVPHARVILDPLDLQLWEADGRYGNRPLTELTQHLGTTGRYLTEDAISRRRENFSKFHDINLWTNTSGQKITKAQLSSALASATTTRKPTTDARAASTSRAAAHPTTVAPNLGISVPTVDLTSDVLKKHPEWQPFATELIKKTADEVARSMAAQLAAAHRALDDVEDRRKSSSKTKDARSSRSPDQDRRRRK